MRLVIAGGGTGGHLFPGIAVAEEFLSRDPANQVLFVGTRAGIEYRLLGSLGYELELIDVEGLKGRGIKALLVGAYKIPYSIWHSRGLLRRFSPDVVIGVGGYASGPVVITAWLMGIPTAIAEQNAVAGVTNRILGKFADRVFLTYERSRKHFWARKVVMTGNPVRAAFAAGLTDQRPLRRGQTILIFGGSQGAQAINRTIVEMLPYLQKMKQDLKIIHQTGRRDLAMVGDAYRRFGIDAQVHEFITDMPAAYAEADLVVCRAGATSLAEITAAGKPSVLIPYPYAANDHQTQNAEVMAEAGAAVMIPEGELSAEKLFALVEELFADEARLQEMGTLSARLGRRGAAAEIVDACEQLVKGNDH